MPRTGSTWLGKILSANGHVNYIHEPDNERLNFMAYYGKQGLPRFPRLTHHEQNKRYAELFHYAFNQAYMTYNSISNQMLKKWVGLTPDSVEADLTEYGINPNRNLNLPYVFSYLLPKQIGNRNKRVVKSVHALLSLDFILPHLTDVKTLFIIRHPAGSISSMLNMNNPDINRKLYTNPLLIKRYPKLQFVNESWSIEKLAGLQASIFYNEIDRLSDQFNSPVVVFEELASQPFEESYKLYQQLGLPWNDHVEQFIQESNQKGEGYETNRISKLQADKWKDELTTEQVEEIKIGYSYLEPNFYNKFYQ